MKLLTTILTLKIGVLSIFATGEYSLEVATNGVGFDHLQSRDYQFVVDLGEVYSLSANSSTEIQAEGFAFLYLIAESLKNDFDYFVTKVLEMIKSDPDAYGIMQWSEILNQVALSKSEGFDEGKIEGKQEGVTSVTSNPTAYDLVTKSAYEQMVDEMIKAQSTSTTHYTEGWFFLPNRGWMWTNLSAYPYFYDSTDSEWMYFQSGSKSPRFYHYGKKTWITIE